MSDSYNSRLKPIGDKGLCGDPEIFDNPRVLAGKLSTLARLVKKAKNIIAFTGAGISTAAGIPDFRGPNGVWTKELQEEEEKKSASKGTKRSRSSRDANTSAPSAASPPSVSFECARPSLSHRALATLVDRGIVKHIISQNVDGLHLKSGVPRDRLSELHGNIFSERCVSCHREYIRPFDVGGMGCQPTGRVCERPGCEGALIDQTIDWDTPLPDDEFATASAAIRASDLMICLGTSLRIRPAGNMPQRMIRKKNGALVIVNLQETHMDHKADLKINERCDTVMKDLCDKLGIVIQHDEQANTEAAAAATGAHAEAGAGAGAGAPVGSTGALSVRERLADTSGRKRVKPES